MTVTAEDSPAQPSHSKAANPVKANTQSQPPPRKHIAQLIGKRCMVSCAINGVPLPMLLDSGAQVTMDERAWMDRALPNVQIQPLKSLLSDQPLDIAAANGTNVPFDGWADVELQVCSKNHGHIAIRVPVLVSQSSLSCPLLGSNVIGEIIKTNQQLTDGVEISVLLKEALRISDSAVEALVSTLQILTPDETSIECSVRTGKKGVTVPAGQICEVSCRVREWPSGGTKLFQPNLVTNCPEGLEFFQALVDVLRGSTKVVKIPVQNATKHDIYLTKRTVLGTLEEVTEVKPVNLFSGSSEPTSHSTVNTCSVQLSTDKQKRHPPVDVSHLEEEEQKIVKDMLYEESDVFAKDDSDIGCIPNLKLKIHFKDETPVQTS